MNTLSQSGQSQQPGQRKKPASQQELRLIHAALSASNEEWHTINIELPSLLDDLSWVNNEIQNLLNSSEIAMASTANSRHGAGYFTQVRTTTP